MCYIMFTMSGGHHTWPDTPRWTYLGLSALTHVPKELRRKLDDKATKCIFVGYSRESKGYRLYDPHSKRIFSSRDVIFDEKSELSMAGYEQKQAENDVFQGLLPMEFHPTVGAPTHEGPGQPANGVGDAEIQLQNQQQAEPDLELQAP